MEFANLTGANLQDADISCANLAHTKLSDSNLYLADLEQANLYKSDLSRANLEKAILSDSYLCCSDLKEAILSESDLLRANLEGANLELANLKCANLEDCNLKCANLELANLTKANLSGANLTRAHFSNTILTGANFSNTILDGVEPEALSYLVKDISDIYIKTTDDLDHIDNESETGKSLILPFIKMLGYDIHNAQEFKSEFKANFRKKGKANAVDFAIQINNEPLIIIETKHHRENLESYQGQLAEYFAASNSKGITKIGILTNGIIYKFFTDDNKENVMDDKPFFEFSFRNYCCEDIEKLLLFHRNFFDITNFKDEKLFYCFNFGKFGQH
jgi:hypothetical protein